MNSIATRLPEGQQPAHRHRPDLAPARFPGPGTDSGPRGELHDHRLPRRRIHRAASHQRARRHRRHLLRRQRRARLPAPARPLHVDRLSRATGTAAFGINTGATWSAATASRRRPRLSTPERHLHHHRCPGHAADGCPRDRRSRADRGLLSGNDEVFRGFIRDRRGLRDIEYPGSGGTVAYGMNALLRVVGGYLDDSGIDAYLLKNGVYTTIDPPGATGANAHGINILGRVVGGWTDDPSVPIASRERSCSRRGGSKSPPFPTRRKPWRRHRRPWPDRGHVLHGGARPLPRIPAHRPRRGRRLRVSIDRIPKRGPAGPVPFGFLMER